MKELIHFFKSHVKHFIQTIPEIKYEFIQKNKFDWRKINLVKIQNHNVHETLTIFFYIFLGVKFNVNQIFFCSSQSTHEDLKSNKTFMLLE